MTMFARLLPTAVLLPCLLALPVGCGEDDTGALDVNDLDAVAAEVSQAICESAYRCADTFPEDSPFEFDLLFGTNGDECLAIQGSSSEDNADIQAAIDAGTVTYRSDKVEGCIDELQGVTCEAIWTESASDQCDLFEGTLESGEACTTDVECITGGCVEGTCF